MGQHMPPIPVVAGPTAGGKSALGSALADLLRSSPGPGAEIVSADAFQIYRGMDIGTAKPSRDERARIAHHLIDVVEPTERYTVFQWLGAAHDAIDRIRAKDGVPIVVGGTHLYIKALLDGMFDGPAPNPELRATLEAMEPARRRAELERADPQAARRIHPNDTRRTVRALEVHRATGRPISELQRQWDRDEPLDHRGFVLCWPEWPAEAINRRINHRVRTMIDAGLVDEARQLHRTGRLGPQARQALGYKQLAEHFEQRATLDEAIERIKIDTRRFAKSQRTWLRRLGATPGSIRLDTDDPEPVRWAAQIVQRLELGRGR